MREKNQTDRKLDQIIRLLEDIFILQALKANLSRPGVRGFLGVDINRVTKLSKMVKAAKRQSEKP